MTSRSAKEVRHETHDLCASRDPLSDVIRRGSAAALP